MPVTANEGFSGNFAGAVGRLRLQGVVFPDGELQGCSIHFTARHEDKGRETGAAGFEEVEGSVEVSLEIAFRRFVGIRNADEGGEVKHEVNAPDPVAAGAGVANIADHNLQPGLGGDGIQPAAVLARVVPACGTHFCPGSQQGFREVRTNEAIGTGHQNAFSYVRQARFHDRKILRHGLIFCEFSGQT